MSNLFGRRLRESASGAESTSHDLLLRAGWVRQHAAGIYSYLTPGLRSLRRIERIVREEMDASGAQEILMPVVHSAEPWKATRRWASIDATLARFRDRHDRDMVLGMTHEEIVAELAASEIASYRQAGVVVYQIQTKFRDELRPRAGLLRTREFIMKDAYSLDIDQAGLEQSYAAQADAYRRIFDRVGVRDVLMVRSSTGDMGGLVAHEFSALHESGEDTIGVCDGCGDAANAELFRSVSSEASNAAAARAAGGADVHDRVTQRSMECAVCGGRIVLRRAIEVGNIFQLGTRYSEALGARVTGPDGRITPLVMGSYGIGVSRLLAVLIEQHHDDAGITLPAAAAPFDVHVLTLGMEDATHAAELVAALERAGLDVLFDDRDVRAGEKFADADLIGATLRVVIAKNVAETGRVEIRERRTRAVHEIPGADAVAAVLRILAAVRGREASPAVAGA